ncbi:MAG: hypothetical protein ACXVCP_18995 [Bdellovibrio sp.]
MLNAKFLKNATLWFTTACFSLNTIGCKVGQNPVNNSMEKVSLALEGQYKVDPIKEKYDQWQISLRVNEIGKATIAALSDIPTLKGQLSQNVQNAEMFVRNNKTALMNYLDKVEGASGRSHEIIYSISKEALLSKDSIASAKDYTLVYFGLMYQAYVYQTLVKNLSVIAVASSSQNFDKSQEILDFRRELLKRYFSYVGLQTIIHKDIARVLTQLKKYKKAGVLLRPLDEAIGENLSMIASQSRSEHSSLKNVLGQASAQQQQQFKTEMDKFLKAFDKVSLLYNPAQKASALFNVISWVGNLTFGLINTLLGAGVVVLTAIVSPFSSSVDFPTLKISASGSQIYADVSGMGPMAGKLSLGLFELDNYAGYSFSSDHEGVHAIQSVIFGPFYLPVVVASYMMSGFDNGFMEDWAWEWAR